MYTPPLRNIKVQIICRKDAAATMSLKLAVLEVNMMQNLIILRLRWTRKLCICGKEALFALAKTLKPILQALVSTASPWIPPAFVMPSDFL